MNRLGYIALGVAGLIAIVYLVRSSSGYLPSLGNDQFAYLIYMGIWGTLIATAVISRPTGIGHSIKQLVAWIGIFLIVMAGYSYRYELQDIASNLTGGLVPGSPLAVREIDGRKQISLVRDANGHFQARGKVEGTNVLFLVDTGATDVVLSFRDASRIGIDMANLSFSVPVSTANGRTFSARHKVQEFAVGPISREPVTVLISAQGALDQSLLGMNFINKLYGFEIRGDRMILTD